MDLSKSKLRRQIAIFSIIVIAAAVAAFFILPKLTQPPDPYKFNSELWKHPWQAKTWVRFDMANDLKSKIIGKSESEVLELLGEPNSTGIGGLMGLKWQPSDGSKAWNYIMIPARWIGHEFRIYIKNGHVIKAESVTYGCD